MVTVKRKPRSRPPGKSSWRSGSNIVCCLGVTVGFLNFAGLLTTADPSSTSSLIGILSIYPRPLLKRHQIGAMPLSQSQYDYPVPTDSASGGVCHFMQPWQGQSFYTNNKIHEFDMSASSEDSMTFINCGSLRCAFLVTMMCGQEEMTLKVQMFDADFEPEYYRRGRRDIVAMERLSSSPYVANVYANGGTSQIVEYSRGGNLHDLVKRARGGDSAFRDLTPLTKLKIAYQVASAVADMHQLEYDNIASLVHYDLCCHQFILIDGVFKLNDFHLAVFIEQDPVHGNPCKMAPNFADSLVKLRPPEEIAAVVGRGDRSVRLDPVDVYMIGNVLYYLHTNQWMFEGISNTEAAKLTFSGQRSPIPQELLNSPNAAIQTLSLAIGMAWHQDADTRPSARDIADFLKDGLKLAGVPNVDGRVVRVDLPKLPPDHRYTDSDFNNNFDGFNSVDEEEAE